MLPLLRQMMIKTFNRRGIEDFFCDVRFIDGNAYEVDYVDYHEQGFSCMRELTK